MADWDSLKFTYRETTKRLDNSIKEIVKVQSDLTRRLRNSAPSVADESSLFGQSAQIFDEYQKVITSCEDQLNRMSRLIMSSDSTKLAQLERFRSALQQSQRDWDRAFTVIEVERSKMELFGNRGKGSGSSNQSTAASTVLQERGALLQSMGVMDSAIDSAIATQEMLQSQRSTISNFGNKLASITSYAPGIHSLVARINSRQCQETFILALVVGVCISILLWMRVLR